MQYLLESNLSHTAFTLLSESSLPSTSLFQHFNPSYPTPSTSSLSSAARIKPTSNSSTSASNGTNANPSAGGDKDKDGAPVPGSGRSATGQRAGHKYGSAEGRVPRGELIRKLWKGLRWEEVERHVSTSGVSRIYIAVLGLPAARIDFLTYRKEADGIGIVQTRMP